jgi:hypothetical protein
MRDIGNPYGLLQSTLLWALLPIKEEIMSIADLSSELWAMSQVAPGHGFCENIENIEARLKTELAPVNDLITIIKKYQDVINACESVSLDDKLTIQAVIDKVNSIVN